MYLAMLNTKEKEVFLGMSYNLATVDGDYSDVEKAIIEGYCQELQYKFDEKTMIKPMDEWVEYIKENSTSKVKKIVLFELIGLAMSDGNYDNDERKFMLHVQKEYGIESDFIEKCENLLNEYLAFQNRLNQIVLG